MGAPRGEVGGWVEGPFRPILISARNTQLMCCVSGSTMSSQVRDAGAEARGARSWL